MANTDKFTIKVNLDAEQAKKGLNQLKQMVEELQRLASKPMSININTKPVDNLNTKLKATSDRLQSIAKGITSSSSQNVSNERSKAQQESQGLAPQSMRSALSQFGFGKIATALTGITAALSVGAKFTADTANIMTKTSNFADAIGANTQQVMMLGQIMKEVGGEQSQGSDILGKAYANMQKMLSSPDSQLAGFFASTGIRIKDDQGVGRDPFDVIKDVSRYLANSAKDPGMFGGDKMTRNIIASRFGLSTVDAEMLSKAQEKGMFTKKSLTQREQSLGVTDVDVKTMRDFNENVQKASIALENLGRQASVKSAGFINELTSEFSNIYSGFSKGGFLGGMQNIGSMFSNTFSNNISKMQTGRYGFHSPTDFGISNWWNNSKEAYQKSQPSAQMNLPNQGAQQPSKNETHIHVNELNVNANNPKEFTDGIMQNTYLDIYNNNSAVQA
jgi:hypothetical protein